MKVDWKACFKIGITAVIVFLFINGYQVYLGKILSAVLPLISGCIIAYIINILMSFYERHYFPHSPKKFFIKSRRPVCMILAALSLVGIISLVMVLVLPQFVECVRLLIAKAPGTFNFLVGRLEKVGFLPKSLMSTLASVDWQEFVSEAVKVFTSRFGDMMNTLFEVVTGVFSFAVGTVLSIVFAFYLLICKDRLIGQCNALIDSYCTPGIGKRIRYTGKVLNESFHSYIVGQSTEAVILGLLCMLGMKIIGLPYESMIGALIAFTSLIPVFGAYVGGITGAFIIAVDNPMDALIFLIFIIVLQQIEGNLIYPKVVGSSVGLPGMWVLAAVTIGGGVFGIPGMLLGVPLTAAIYRIVRHDVRKKVKALRQKEEPAVAEGLAKAPDETVSTEPVSEISDDGANKEK